MKQNFCHPGRLTLGALAVSLAVLLALALTMRLCWPRDAFSLTDLEGDTAALEGFALGGGLEIDTNGHQLGVRFTMQDGQLTNTLTTGRSSALQNAWIGFSTALPAAQREALDAQAAEGKYSEWNSALMGLAQTSSSGIQRSVSTDQVEIMLTVDYDAPDGVVRSVRFPCGQLTLSQPLTFAAEIGYRDGEPYVRQDYTANASEQWNEISQTWESRTAVLADGAVVALNNTGDVPGTQSGLYLVGDGLTQSEILALPADATVGDCPVQSRTLAYGTVHPVWTMPQGGKLVDLVTTGDSIALFYLDDSGCHLLTMDQQGGNQQILDLTDALPDGNFRGLETLRPDEVACATEEAQPDGGRVDRVQVFRLAAGRITAQGSCLPDQIPTYDTAVAMSEDGSRLLTVSSVSDLVDLPDSSGGQLIWKKGCTLEVWQQGTGTALCTAQLKSQRNVAKGWSYGRWNELWPMGRLLTRDLSLTLDGINTF